MLVNCLEHGGGESEDVERLLIMEPLNQNPYTVEIDGEIRIKCVASGFVEEVKTYWERMKGPGNIKHITSMYNPTPEDSNKYEARQGSSSGDDTVDVFYLTIKHISYEDEAGYNCYTFYGGKKIESTLLLKVDGPPNIKLFEQFISVQEGFTVNLSCHFRAKPKPYNTSYWSLNGIELQTVNHSAKYSASFRSIPGIMLGYGEFNLQIKDAKTTDSGNYTCLIVNYFGRAVETIDLQVSKAWNDSVRDSGVEPLTISKIYPDSRTLNSDLYSEFKVICAVKGFAYPQNMTWAFYGVAGNYLQLSADEEVMISDTTVKTFSTQNRTGCFYTLYVDRLHFSNSGKYVCEASSVDTGLAMDYLNMTVSGMPIVESSDFVLNATLGQSISMKCHIWSYPHPSYTVWKLEDSLLSSSSRYKTEITGLNPIEQNSLLTISSITTDDFGVYACRVYNTLGSAMAIHIIQDVNECSYNPPCNQGCKNNIGSYICVCNDGYAFTNDSLTYCEDINECIKPETQTCSQICTNLNGSFLCSCKDGYTIESNNYDCKNNMDLGSGEENETDQLSMEITPETLYTVIGVCAGGLLAIVLLILTAIYCRRLTLQVDECDGLKSVFNSNVAYEKNAEKDDVNLNCYLSNINNSILKDEFPRQSLQLGIDLGQGRFGKVMMARALNISGHGNWEMVAVKTCRGSSSDCEKEDLIQELDVMRKIPKHKNIVSYLGCCTKQDPVYILMEYVKGGNLQSYLRKCRPSQQTATSEEILPPSAKDLKMISLGVARGMSNLHTSGIIHRDLSARNILITPDFTCKICDFGLSRDVEGCDVYERTSKGPLPIRWMAPESLNDQMFTKKTDVWSYGVLLWEIVTLGATPYPGMTVREVIQDVTIGKWLQKPFHCKQELYLLMTRCWGAEPESRPTFKEIVCDVESLLSQEAEYIELNTYQEDKYNMLENTSDERV